jgi:hypothetical protein
MCDGQVFQKTSSGEEARGRSKSMCWRGSGREGEAHCTTVRGTMTETRPQSQLQQRTRTHTYAQTEIHSELEGTEGQVEIERTLRRRRRVRADMINPIILQDGGSGGQDGGGTTTGDNKRGRRCAQYRNRATTTASGRAQDRIPVLILTLKNNLQLVGNLQCRSDRKRCGPVW